MKIAIIGTGKMARGFATALSSQHEVVFGSRNPDKAAKVVAATGAAHATSYEDAASSADLVILAVPWKAIDETLSQLGKLDGTVVIDITVPYGKEIEALGTRSSGEVVQKKLRGARVVKAWSHVFAKFLTDPEVDGIQSSVLIAGDDEAAKDLVSQVARDMRFHPVDVGRLRQSHHLDRLVSMVLFVKLGRFRVLDAPP
jgi:8-hydroxy-5-deazaflavin:NADPH oxidoreductase